MMMKGIMNSDAPFIMKNMPFIIYILNNLQSFLILKNGKIGLWGHIPRRWKDYKKYYRIGSCLHEPK